MSDFRYDFRSKDDFIRDIKRSTLIERWLLDLYINHMRSHNIIITYENTGTDNSGEYTNKATYAPDYNLTFTTGRAIYNVLTEIKTSPIGNDKRSTFKTASLEATIKNQVSLLIFYNIATKSENFKEDTDLTKVLATWVSPESQAAWLKEYPSKSRGRLMGGKPCIEIPAKDYSRWFNFFPLLSLPAIEGLDSEAE